MKNLQGLYFLLIIAAMLSGCVPSDLTIKPTSIVKLHLLPTPTPVTPTLISSPVPSPTLTLPATLASGQAENIMNTLLQEPVDCTASCFWGIMPGKTTISEAKSIFTHLGLQVWRNTLNNKEFYGIDHKFNSSLSIGAALTIQDEIVENLTVNISPEKQKVGVPKKWLAYSPETLIKQYGPPSKVDFFLGRVAPTPIHSMVLYFDAVNLIVEYSGTDILQISNGPKLRICPLINQVDLVRIWMGHNPQHPPSSGVTLEKATTLTTQTFSKLMTEDPNKACVNLKEEMFP